MNNKNNENNNLPRKLPQQDTKNIEALLIVERAFAESLHAVLSTPIINIEELLRPQREAIEAVTKTVAPLLHQTNKQLEPFLQSATEIQENLKKQIAPIVNAIKFPVEFFPRRDGKFTLPLPRNQVVQLDPVSTNYVVKEVTQAVINILREERERRKPEQPKGLFIQYKDENFYAGSKLVDFSDRQAIYVKLVKALLFKSESTGLCRYEVVNKFLEQEGEGKIIERILQTKRILNALQNLYRRRHKQSVPFPRRAPDGRAIISISEGEGLIFYNPER